MALRGFMGQATAGLRTVKFYQGQGVRFFEVPIGMTGSRGGEMKDLCDHCLEVPSSDTPKIQEGHAVLGHILCSLVERALFKAPA
jgi:hypothetical protein